MTSWASLDRLDYIVTGIKVCGCVRDGSTAGAMLGDLPGLRSGFLEDVIGASGRLNKIFSQDCRSCLFNSQV